jgi:hypothetical protein
MLSTDAKKRLLEMVDYDGPCTFEIERKSKWTIVIKIVDGMCLIAAFKFNCKNHTMERTV